VSKDALSFSTGNLDATSVVFTLGVTHYIQIIISKHPPLLIIMNQQQVILYKCFSANNLAAENMGKNRMGGNQVMLSYLGNRSIAMQLPSMLLPFGLQEYAPTDNPTAIKYSIDVSFRKLAEFDTRVDAMKKLIREIDERMVEMAYENSILWFGKTLTKEVVRALYRPLEKQSKQPDKYDPTMKIKIRTLDPEMREDFKSGSTVKTIVEFTPIWFLNRQFGVNVALVNHEVVQRSMQRTARIFDFVHDEDEDDLAE
jgi:hypothetical protein